MKIPQSDSFFQNLKLLNFKRWLWIFKKKNPHFQSVLVGSYNNLYNISIIGEYEERSKIFLLYDGMQMLSVPKIRKVEGKGVRKLPKTYLKLGFKQAKINFLNYIGPFPLETPENDSYIKSHNKKRYRQPSLLANEMYFVGQPLIGNDVIDRNFYFKVLKELKQIFPNKKITYVPHPREREEDIDEIKQILPIQVFSKIFEEEYINSSEFPEAVISFYSSVLLNLCFLEANVHLFSVKIPEDEYKVKDNAENIGSIMKYMEKANYPKLKFLEFQNKELLLE